MLLLNLLPLQMFMEPGKPFIDFQRNLLLKPFLNSMSIWGPNFSLSGVVFSLQAKVFELLGMLWGSFAGLFQWSFVDS